MLTRSRRIKWPKVTRDLALFTAGLLIALNEAFLRDGAVRGEIIIMASGMMGLPAFLSNDSKREEKK